MNLVETLAKEHSKAQCNLVVRYVGKDAGRFRRLVEVFLGGPYRITQRAAWPLSYCVQFHPELIRPHLKAILQNLKRPGASDSVKRNTIRLLQFIEIPKRLHGLTATVCFQLFQNQKEAIAIRVFSMTVLAQIARDQPALKNELKIMIEDQLPYAAPAFVARSRKILKQLT
jgi:hypothetical protein